jgi:PAS domain S-box-containing protein
MPLGVIAFDTECRYTVWNPVMESVAGLPADRVLGRVAWEAFPFLLEVGEDACFRAVLEGEEEVVSERPFRVPESGREGIFEGRYRPLRDDEGRIVGGMAVIRDVTHSRRAEEALRMQGLVLQSMSEGVSVSDEEGFILFTNPAEDRIFGYGAGELVGRHVTVQNAYPPEENQRIVGEVIEALRRDGVWMGEWKNRRKDGSTFPTFARITSLEMGGRRYWVCVQEDVTERKRAEEERSRLLDSERRARAAAERLGDLTAALSGALTTPEVGSAAMRHGVVALSADAGVLALVAADEAELEIVGSHGYPPEACMGPGRRWPLQSAIPIAESTRTGLPVLVRSPAEWAERYTGGYAPNKGASAAWAALPVVVEGRTAGALLWTFHAPREFDAAEVDLMETIARQCSQALERAHLLDAERRARAEAEAANRSKTEFLSAMSHELRTPLNAIAGYVDLLALEIHGPITEQQRTDLARIHHAQQVLLSLINDVLNFARLEAGRIEYRADRVPVEDLLSGLEPIIEPQVRSRGLSYRCEIPDPGLSLIGDSERINQILLNLVSNAVKFTDPGGTIHVEAFDEATHVRLAVRDTGRGIPADRLEQIFEAFVQLERHRTEDSQKGVGLGLAISRELARGMGGELTAVSEPGVGSTFSLTLPRAQCSDVGATGGDPIAHAD